MKRVLMIEDDINICNMLKKFLELNNYQVMIANDGYSAMEKCDKTIDIILLDLMLPHKNGKELIKELKQIVTCPVIIVSAISEVDTKVLLFDLGADDYITKPFSNKELLARMKLVFKHERKENIISYKEIEMNIENHIVKCEQKEIPLTKNEFEILKLLLMNKGQIVTKTTLFDQVWGMLESADENTLNVHISKIRNKLKEINSNREYIETIWKVGYKLK